MSNYQISIYQRLIEFTRDYPLDPYYCRFTINERVAHFYRMDYDSHIDNGLIRLYHYTFDDKEKVSIHWLYRGVQYISSEANGVARYILNDDQYHTVLPEDAERIMKMVTFYVDNDTYPKEVSSMEPFVRFFESIKGNDDTVTYEQNPVLDETYAFINVTYCDIVGRSHTDDEFIAELEALCV